MARARLGAVMLLAIGCDGVFDLDRLQPVIPDATLSHDEDGDGVADDADRCAGFYDPLQPDDDDDGVGDACDSHRGVVGDRLIAAEFFAGSSQTWIPSTASDWALSNDVMATTPNVDMVNTRITLAIAATRPTLELRLKLLAFGSATVDSVLVQLNYRNNPSSCELRVASGDAGVQLFVVTDLSFSQPAYLSTAITPDGVAIVQFVRDAMARCTVNGVTKQLPSTQTWAPGEVTATIEIVSMAVVLEYALLYDAP